MCECCAVCEVTLLSIEDRVCVYCYKRVFNNSKEFMEHWLPALNRQAVTYSKLEVSLREVFGKPFITA